MRSTISGPTASHVFAKAGGLFHGRHDLRRRGLCGARDTGQRNGHRGAARLKPNHGDRVLFERGPPENEERSTCAMS